MVSLQNKAITKAANKAKPKEIEREEAKELSTIGVPSVLELLADDDGDDDDAEDVGLAEGDDGEVVGLVVGFDGEVVGLIVGFVGFVGSISPQSGN